MNLLEMDKAPLNRAHQLERRAEQFNRKKKFDECIQCHKEAAECLTKCLKSTDNPVSIDSVQRQKEWHERQIETVLLKKQYFLRMQKLKESASNNAQVVENLQYKIFRTMETHDSLIYYLGKRDRDAVDAPTSGDLENNDRVLKEESPPLGSKHPKDDAQVIEELKLLSNQLREAIRGLLLQLEDRNKEIEKLKERIKTLEEEKERGFVEKKQEQQSTLKIVGTDSSGGTSPYVFSPLTELLPDLPGNFNPLKTLHSPTQEHLEILNMKFEGLSSMYSSSSSNEGDVQNEEKSEG